MQTRAPAVTAGHQSVTGGGADSGTGVGVGKDHALLGELIDAGRFDLTVLRVQALDIAVAEVVTHDEDDVGL